MGRPTVWNRLSSFQLVIMGFLAVILLGTLLLTLPFSARSGHWTAFSDALFTATSAVCVTGLVVRDTATYWSGFGQAVILLLIQIGGLGVASMAALIALLSGRRISLLQRSTLQDALSAHQIGGVVKMTAFLLKIALIVELAGTLLLLPVFCTRWGTQGLWMALFHSVSAFCNAGFDVMGDKTGPFSSLCGFSGHPGLVLMICLLIVLGGLGFLTWDDFRNHRWQFKSYRMQSKVILCSTAVLIVVPAVFLFLTQFREGSLSERLCLSLFQAVTPRTAGFNTADFSALSPGGRTMMIVLMLIGGSPGSTAGGMKTTTAAVLLTNALAVFRRRKSVTLFGRRLEEGVVNNAGALLLLYLLLPVTGAVMLSEVEGLPMGPCLFETASALGTVGLSLGLTPTLGTLSRMILIALMFLGRVGGLTLIYAMFSGRGLEVSQRPVEKIMIG